MDSKEAVKPKSPPGNIGLLLFILAIAICAIIWIFAGMVWAVTVAIVTLMMTVFIGMMLAFG